MKIINSLLETELPKISWKELKTYQFNDLKESKNRDISKLKNSIVNEGFCFPFFVWKRFVLDGAGRSLAIKELEAEGYEIPELPIIELKANNLQHAKKLALMVSSRHGEITFLPYKKNRAEIKSTRYNIKYPWAMKSQNYQLSS